MPMTKVGADEIMLLFALTECRRALDSFAEVTRLAAVREQVAPGVERRENVRVFDAIRLGLQTAANVSRLFWPPRNKVRGNHLRSIAGIPDDHGLSDRTLRNHIEHVDERLDDWTKISPRPFLTIELVLDEDYPDDRRGGVIEASAIVYDVRSEAVHLFGDSFSLSALSADLEDVLQRISQALSTPASSEVPVVR